MKKHFLVISCFLALLTVSTAQIYSEAPITIVDGRMFTDMLYVKFTSHAIMPGIEGTTQVSGEALSSAYPHIRSLFAGFSQRRNLSLADIAFRKAISRARPEDTVYVDVYTGERRKLPDLSRVFLVEFPRPVDIDSLIIPLKLQPEVEYSHGPVQLVDCAVQPNDTAYVNGKQWYLDTLQAPQAWEISKGSAEIKIALIETQGVPDQDHPDLVDKIVSGGDTWREGEHATMVAGFAGAMTNNVTGIASLGWNIRLLTYYAPTADDPDREFLAGKIDEAVEDGADIINCSFKTVKGNFTSCGLPKGIGPMIVYYYKNWDYELVDEAIESAISQNVLVVAAAGNDAGQIEGQFACEDVPYPCYPAQYPGVIAVSGSYKNGDFVSTWNYGDSVDVNAPGKTTANQGLYTTTIGGGYTDEKYGTSFSAPMVSALAALIKSLEPTLSPAEIEDILESSADKIGQYSYDENGWNMYFGYGRINAHAALLEILLTVYITGPSCLGYKELGTYTAHADGGIGSYDYQWYRKYDGASQWYWIGSGQTKSIRMVETSFTLKVVVSSGIQTAEATKHVEYVEGIPKQITNLPESYALNQSHPNPFNPVTTIRYDLPEASNVNLTIYDMMGREVRRWNLQDSPGYKQVVWDGQDNSGRLVPTGIYIYRLVAIPTVGDERFTASRKMLLLK